MNRWQKYIDICNMINFWLALYWRKKKKSRLIERYDLSLMMFPVLGVAATWVSVFKAVLPHTVDGACKGYAYMSFHFFVAAVGPHTGRPHCRMQSYRDAGCTELHGPETHCQRWERAPFPSSSPLLQTHTVTCQEGDWLNCCFSSQKRPEAQREGGEKHNPAQEGVLSPNELQGGQAQHVLSKEGLCKIPDKILAVG